METPALFTRSEPDPIGVMLGTGFQRFETVFGISGLAKWNGDQLDILAVGAKREGQGQFRTFIAQAKKHFRTIYVWEDWNPVIGQALSRYGFVPCGKTEPDGEKLNGWEWRDA